MRRILLIAVLAALGVITGGYCIAWYTQASHAKTNVEQFIANLNKQQTYLTYDAIETSGFPSALQISIVRPHFSGRVDELWKSLMASVPPTEQPAAGMPLSNLAAWNEDMLLDGRVVMSINALSDHYSLRFSGPMQSKSNINGQEIATAYEPAGEFTCNLQLQQGSFFGSLWNFSTLEERGKEVLNDFRALDCVSLGNTISNAQTKEKLSSVGPQRFYITHDMVSGTRQLRAYIKVSDAEVLPAADPIIKTYMDALTIDSSFPFSAYGKQNVEMDFAFTGPVDWQNNNTNQPFSITLSKFDLLNNIYTTTASFYLNNGTTGVDRSARLALKAESAFTPAYNDLLQSTVRRYIRQVYADPDLAKSELRPVSDTLHKYTPEEMYNIVSPALPDLPSLGKIVQNIDASYQGSADFTSGSANLAAFEMSATPYGITGSGSAKMTQGHLPQSSFTFAWANCFKMIDDIASYVSRLRTAVAYFDPQQAQQLNLEPDLVQGVKDFLSALAGPASGNASAFTYAIASNDTGITINGKDMNSVMGLYREYLLPAVNRRMQNMAAEQAPAAGTPATPGAIAPIPAPASPAAPQGIQ